MKSKGVGIKRTLCWRKGRKRRWLSANPAHPTAFKTSATGSSEVRSEINFCDPRITIATEKLECFAALVVSELGDKVCNVVDN